MNLILLQPDDFTSPNTVLLQGRRFQHIRDIHRAQPEQQLKVGVVNGLMGPGVITDLNENSLTLTVQLNQQPPPQLPLTLIMALPRPKMLKRIFQTVATFGVRELILINAYNVEKSYWQTPWLADDKVHEHLCIGLEQGVATQLPTVRQVKRFKPFVEDELPALCLNKRSVVAHPYHAQPCPLPEAVESVIAMGPEGGFIPYEVEKLQAAGMTAVELGSRILRVETALAVLLGRLF